VTVSNNNAPSISCPAAVTVTTNECDAVVSYNAPTTNDLCGCEMVSLSAGLPSGSTFPIGTTTNQFDVVDDTNNVVGNNYIHWCFDFFIRSFVH
jgi:hypothetical protein